MHVLHLSATGTLGGAERSLLDILASTREAHPAWSLSVIAGSAGALAAAAAAHGVRVTVLPYGAALGRLGEAGSRRAFGDGAAFGLRLAASAWPALRYARDLRHALSRLKPDVVHTHGLKMHILAAHAFRGMSSAHLRPRLVWHLHDYVGTRPTTARLLRWSLPHCAAIVTNSASVEDDVRRTLDPGVPVIAVHNAVDLERFTPRGPRLDLDRLAGLPPAAGPVVRVGLLGAFGRWKGHRTFFAALARLPGTPAIRGYVIGGPLYHTAGSQYSVEELRADAAHKGLAGRVGFTGFVESPEDALRALDIVVHASTAPEPFGLVIAEAMACGRAVIASDAGGARELFTPGVDALPHPPGDDRALANRIGELAADPALRRRLGAAGRDTAERRFNRLRLARELAPAYRPALRAAS